MTATLAALRPGTTWTIGAPRLLAGLAHTDVVDLATHRHLHGTMPGLDLDRLLALLDGAGLTGRGGAGFPLAAKLRALADGGTPWVIVNGSESEPASRKDRTLLRCAPHLVLDGALAVAGAISARNVTLAVHDPAAAASLRAAVAERPDARRVHVVAIPGRFVAGEARALVRALRGGPAVPPGHADHPSAQGVLLSNAETFAQTAILARLGVRRFGETGTHHEPGTVLLTVGGAVARPGVVEVPLGTPLGIVLRAAAAERTAAVVTGGYHGSWLYPQADVPVSRAGLAAAGASLGAGVVLAVDEATCALGELARVTDWLAAQSAAQCGPCRFGLPALADDVRALAAGIPAAYDAAMRHAATVTGRGACRHPDGTARFVATGLAVLRDELHAHRSGGCGRPVLGQLPVGAS